MEGEIRQAAERLKERQDAAAIVRPEHFTEAGRESLLASARAVFSGTDLAFEEVGEGADAAVRGVQSGLRQYGVLGLGPLVAGVFCEALLLGLLIAEAREREAARS